MDQADDGKGFLVIRTFQTRAAAVRDYLAEGGSYAGPEPQPRCFWGSSSGSCPSTGFKPLAAVSLALLFKLNKPLTVACTFINNPLLQPAIVVSSVELGYFLRGGSFQAISSFRAGWLAHERRTSGAGRWAAWCWGYSSAGWEQPSRRLWSK